MKNEPRTNYVVVNGTLAFAPAGAVAYKYSDPTELGRWINSTTEAARIANEDPGLITWTFPGFVAWDATRNEKIDLRDLNRTDLLDFRNAALEHDDLSCAAACQAIISGVLRP